MQESAALIEELRLEEISVVFAIAYLVLAIRQSLWCWPAALISVALAAVVVLDAKLYMDVALQVFYVAMAIYGWQQWRRGGDRGEGIRVHRWPVTRHALAIGFIMIASLVFWLVLRGTEAAYPFLDSLTAIASVVTTFMVARKIIENWIYWFVIDSVLVWLYFARDLYWFAGLYAAYLVMVVIGFRAWRKSLREERAADAGLAR
jgi:nicotinamide mononucleotide transporter